MIDREYEGGDPRSSAGDPLARLLRCGNLGGFRIRRRQDGLYLFAVLYTSGGDADWPDVLDTETGVFTHYGGNKAAWRGLEATPRGGNRLLSFAFDALHGRSWPLACPAASWLWATTTTATFGGRER